VAIFNGDTALNLNLAAAAEVGGEPRIRPSEGRHGSSRLPIRKVDTGKVFSRQLRCVKLFHHIYGFSTLEFLREGISGPANVF
jgi:hypothetical protein